MQTKQTVASRRHGPADCFLAISRCFSLGVYDFQRFETRLKPPDILIIHRHAYRYLSIPCCTVSVAADSALCNPPTRRLLGSFSVNYVTASFSSIMFRCGACLLLPCIMSGRFEPDVALKVVQDASLRSNYVVPLHLLSVRVPLIERNVQHFHCTLDSGPAWVICFCRPCESQRECGVMPHSAPYFPQGSAYLPGSQ